ncbi:MAG TPA: AI-2E family transporter [Gammaproteobacteria bacterium]|nr:AI-2E family transporter [Gammaproteobacteria bacterium]
MSAFSFTEFYQRNRRVVIWFILFLLLYALREFFGLVFLSFVLAIIAAPMIQFGERRIRMPHWLSLTVVYVMFLLVLASFVRFVVPSVASEVNRMILNLPTIELRLIEAKNGLVDRYPTLRQPLTGFLRSALPDAVAASVDQRLASERERFSVTEAEISAARESEEVPTGNLAAYFNRQDQLYLSAIMSQQFQRIRDYAPTVINMLYRATATTLLALLFSYLILRDVGRMKRGIERLRTSKVGDFYKEAAPPIARFGMLVGRAIEAQATIAVINTALTIVGLLLLHIPLVAMLSVIVFICSFIPVLGVVISTIPIVLVALNDGGLSLSAAAIGMVVVIHAIEAYVLNPLIYGRHLKLNPVLTLIILYVCYHAFGLWGMLLGVPVARYFIHDVLGVPFRDRGGPAVEPAETAAAPPAPVPPARRARREARR